MYEIINTGGILLAPIVIIWIFINAKKIGVKSGDGWTDMGPAGWAFASLLFWPIALPLYLFKRRKFIDINS